MRTYSAYNTYVNTEEGKKAKDPVQILEEEIIADLKEYYKETGEEKKEKEIILVNYQFMKILKV